jgi:membrane-bound lytic murein transglycosylase B
MCWQCLAQAEKKPNILDAIARPAEKAKPWKDYRKIFITDARIEGGVDFWLTNEQVLQEVSEQYSG